MMASDVPMHMHADLVRHVENPENLVEHRNDDRAAADAEQAGENADHDAGATITAASQTISLIGNARSMTSPENSSRQA